LALAGKIQGKTKLTLSGSRAYAIPEVATLAGQTAGKAIEVVPVTADALMQGMLANGVPDTIAQLVASIDRHIAAGGLTLSHRLTWRDSVERNAGGVARASLDQSLPAGSTARKHARDADCRGSIGTLSSRSFGRRNG